MAFKFKMVASDGSARGTFTTAAPDWRVGDVVLLSPKARVKILETREPGDHSLTGEWVVEPLTDAAD
jgi:hypothetical protein